MTLDELYAQQEWEAFASQFLDLYEFASCEGQLNMLRILLTKYRRNEVLELIVDSL